MPLSDEERRLLTALKDRTRKRIYDAEWKRLHMALVEVEFAQRPNLWKREEDRNWYREKESKWCDYYISTDRDHEEYQQRLRLKEARSAGRRLPPEATQDERLAALAERLGISIEKCGLQLRRGTFMLTTEFGLLKTQDGSFVHSDDSALVEDLRKRIGFALIPLQPEFLTLFAIHRPGRPRGGRNKELNPGSMVTEGALRQRRRREKKRQSKIRRS
jgi:hypothetical protein